MKVLIIQESGRNQANAHMRECLSLAHSLKKLNVSVDVWGLGHNNHSINDKPYLNPVYDVILCLENYDNGWLPSDLHLSKSIKLFWSIDSHCALNEHKNFVDKYKPHLVLSSTSSYLKEYENMAPYVAWFPNAVDTRWFKEATTKKTEDIVFIASMIAGRENVAEILSKTVDVKTHSNLIGDDYVKMLGTSFASFNKSIADDINYRVFESTACRTTLITNTVPDLDKLFKLDEDIACYSSAKEMIGICQWLKYDKAAAYQIAENGYKRTINNHTYDHRAQLLVNLVKNI